MKGQITRHEWELTSIGVLECKNCPVKKVLAIGEEPTYYIKYYNKETRLLTEPKCITRKKPEDENRN